MTDTRAEPQPAPCRAGELPSAEEFAELIGRASIIPSCSAKDLLGEINRWRREREDGSNNP